MKEFFTIGFYFFIAQLIYVILTTVKTLVMSRFNNAHLSATINAITYGFYTTILKMISGLPLYVTVTATIITNFFGVYISYWLVERIRKRELWKVEVYRKQGVEEIVEGLEKLGLGFTVITDKLLNVYCYSDNDSRKLRLVLSDYKNVKTNVIAINKKL